MKLPVHVLASVVIHRQHEKRTETSLTSVPATASSDASVPTNEVPTTLPTDTPDDQPVNPNIAPSRFTEALEIS